MEVTKWENSNKYEHQDLSFGARVHQQICFISDKDWSKEFIEYINQTYSPIYEKLDNGSFVDFSQFEKQLWEAKQTCLDNAPDCISRYDKICSHYLNILYQNAPNFIKLTDVLSNKPSPEQKSSICMPDELNEYKSKIELLEQTIKVKELENDKILSQKHNMTKIFELKEVELKEQIQFYTDQLEVEQDKASDLECQIERFKQTIEWETSKRKQAENKLDDSTAQNNVISQCKDKIKQLEQELNLKADKDSNENIEKLTQTNHSLEVQLNKAVEDHKLAKLQYEKGLAVKEQKLSFYETELSEIKSKLQQSESLYKSLMEAFGDRNCWGGVKKLNDSIEEIIHDQRNQANEEIKTLKNNHKQAKESYIKEIEKLTEKNKSLELDLKVKCSEFMKDIEQLRTQNDGLIAEKQSLNLSIKNLESQHMEMVESIKKQYRERIEWLENDISQKEKLSQQNIYEVQQWKQSSLQELKQHYESEKRNFEERSIRERKVNQQKLEQLQEEHDNQFKEQQEEHEDEIEMMQEQIRQLEAELEEGTKLFEQELHLSRQKIEHLGNNLQEAKDSLSQYQRNSSKTLDKQLTKFSDERQNMLSKIDSLNSQVTKREKQVTIYK